MKPQNLFSTITNLSYIIAGALVWSQTAVIGSVFIILGLASIGYHWKKTRGWRRFDIVMILYSFPMIAGYLWLGLFGEWLGFTVATIATVLYLKFNFPERWFIGITGILCIVAHSLWSALVILAVFLVALGVGQLADRHPDDSLSYDIFHAPWHVITAFGMYLLIIL